MKTIGFIMKNKMIVGVVAVVIVVLLYMSYTGVNVFGDSFEDGSPEGTMSIFVSDARGNVYNVDIPVKELSPTATLQPLTTYSQTLVGITNSTRYTIGFSMNGVIQPQADVVISDTETLITTLDITGNAGIGVGDSTIYGVGDGTTFTENIYTTVSTTPNSTFTLNPAHVFDRVNNVDNFITGTQLDDSVFIFEIVSYDAATTGLQYYGVTTVTLTFIVDWDGNLSIGIDSINGEVE